LANSSLGAAPQEKGTKLLGNAVSVRELSFGKIRDAALHYSPTLSALAKQTLALFLGRCPRLEFANAFGVHWVGSSSILLPFQRFIFCSANLKPLKRFTLLMAVSYHRAEATV